jgi:uncharacterized membrane protein (DUF2068 family)
MKAQRIALLHGNSEHIVRYSAFTLAAWGFWMLLRGYRGIWRSAECLLTCSNVDWGYIWIVIFTFTWSGILPAIAVLDAYGLFQLRLWGQRLALTICSIVFVVELYGA